MLLAPLLAIALAVLSLVVLGGRGGLAGLRRDRRCACGFADHMLRRGRVRTRSADRRSAVRRELARRAAPIHGW